MHHQTMAKVEYNAQYMQMHEFHSYELLDIPDLTMPHTDLVKNASELTKIETKSQAV